MVHGTVLWFDSEKGFGFIAQDGGGPDVFVDYLEVAGAGVGSLEGGQRVVFDLRHGTSGPGAVGVRVIGCLPRLAGRRRLPPGRGGRVRCASVRRRWW